MHFSALIWTNDKLKRLDQRQLLAVTTYCEYTDYEDVAQAIRDMVVRGAPAIGVTAAFGLAIAARQSSATTIDALVTDLQAAGEHLVAARPTAVNLSWAVTHLLKLASHTAAASDSSETVIVSLKQALLTEAQALYQADIEACKRLGTFAQALILNPFTTFHCMSPVPPVPWI